MDFLGRKFSRVGKGSSEGGTNCRQNVLNDLEAPKHKSLGIGKDCLCYICKGIGNGVVKESQKPVVKRAPNFITTPFINSNSKKGSKGTYPPITPRKIYIV